MAVAVTQIVGCGERINQQEMRQLQMLKNVNLTRENTELLNIRYLLFYKDCKI